MSRANWLESWCFGEEVSPKEGRKKERKEKKERKKKGTSPYCVSGYNQLADFNGSMLQHTRHFRAKNTDNENL